MADLVKAKTNEDYLFMDANPTSQPLQWTHCINSLTVSYFPNTVQPNKYLRMWWGVQQTRSEPYAAFIPRVVDLIEDATGHALQFWRTERCSVICS